MDDAFWFGVAMPALRRENGNLAHRDSKLPEAYRHAAPHIEQKFLGSYLHQRAWSETVRPRCGRGGAKQRDLEILPLSQRRVHEDYQYEKLRCVAPRTGRRFGQTADTVSLDDHWFALAM